MCAPIKNLPYFSFKRITLCLFLSLLTGLIGCATTKESSSTAQKDDPYENINREVYHFNDKVDDYVAKPVADAYKFITPDFMENGVSNFFNNLKSINVVLNDVLQGKFEQSGRDTSRFLMNSTLGMAGLFDVAKSVGLEQNDEDFDQTLAVWGVPQGSYIVLPFLGPITTRGIPGAVFDSAANPATYISPIIPIQALSLVNARANAEGSLKFIDEAALDPYVFTRESFLQWRKHLATDGKESSTDINDLDAELLGDTDPSPKKADSGNPRASATNGQPPSSLPSTMGSQNAAPQTNAPKTNSLQPLPPDAPVKSSGNTTKLPQK
jgi:phospholipid-binding lipoprotein MlaA